MSAKTTVDVAEVDVKQLVADTDTGGRKPGPAVGKLLLALRWRGACSSCGSPRRCRSRSASASSTTPQSRAIHLAFAVFLAYLAYPAFKRSPRDRVPVLDWVFALVGAFCAAYLFLFYRELATRPGQPTTQDLVVAVDRHRAAARGDAPRARAADGDRRAGVPRLHLRRAATCPT